MHVLHHTGVKVVEEWGVKPQWIRYFISPAVSIFHPVPPSPRLSALWFFFLFLLFAERADCAALSVCMRRIVPFFLSMMRKAWNNNVWGWSATPLFSVSSPLPLCSRFSRWQWCSLQISCRCGPFDPLWDKLHSHPCAHTHTYTPRFECKGVHRHAHAHTFA